MKTRVIHTECLGQYTLSGPGNPRWKEGADHKEARRRPGARKAYNALRRAIKKGIVKKQPCEVCGNPEVEAHHDDYGKPLEVHWLCRKHHYRADEALGHQNWPHSQKGEMPIYLQKRKGILKSP